VNLNAEPIGLDHRFGHLGSQIGAPFGAEP